MSCTPIKMRDGSTAILCSRSARMRFCRCGAVAEALCDARVRDPRRQTGYSLCSRPICAAHRQAVGKKDYCDEHPASAQAELL